jgi:glc operon protein GlcG
MLGTSKYITLEGAKKMVAGGKTAFLAVERVVPMQGGVPVIVEGKVIGAVGVSGVTSAQDEQVAGGFFPRCK